MKPNRYPSSSTAYAAGSNRIASETDAAGNTTRYTYYSQGSVGAGKIKSITLPDNSVQYRAYTLRGESKVTWGTQTYSTWKEYDALGQLAVLHTWQSAPALNADSLPASPPVGSATTTWTYDPGTGLTASKRDAAGKGADYQYDVAGQLSKRTWARLHAGVRLATTYGRNPFGELTAIGYADAIPGVAVTYDRLGRTASTGNGVAGSVYAYDPATLLTDTETVSYDLNGDAIADLTRVLNRSRDAYLRNTGYQLKNGATVETQAIYGYDTAGRLGSVSGGADVSTPELFTYGYTPNSRLLGTMTGPVHTVTNVWEENRDVLDFKENKVGNAVVSRFDHAVNAIGQRTEVAAFGTAFSSAKTTGWGYDALGQVTSADSTDNAAAYPLPAAPSANSALTWDAENRLTSTTAGGVTTTYLYDAFGRRIAKKTGGSTTAFLYDGWNCVAEYAGTVLIKTQLWGIDLSGTLQDAGGVGGLLSVGSGELAYYPTCDGNGNVSEYLGSAGAIAAHFEYDPFGNTVVNSDTANQFAYRFSTKPSDAETGLYYYGYRFYNPNTGRWLNRDPLGQLGGLNVYHACFNNLINQVDFLGLWSLKIGAGLGLGGFLELGCNGGQLSFDVGAGAASGGVAEFSPTDTGSDDCGEDHGEWGGKLGYRAEAEAGLGTVGGGVASEVGVKSSGDHLAGYGKLEGGIDIEGRGGVGEITGEVGGHHPGVTTTKKETYTLGGFAFEGGVAGLTFTPGGGGSLGSP